MTRFLLLLFVVFSSCQKDTVEKLEFEKLESEKLESEKLEFEKLESEKLESEKLESEKLEFEKLDQIRIKTQRDKFRFNAFKTHIKSFKTLNNAKVAFVLSVAKNARVESRVSNIPASLYVAMAIQETGWGTSKAFKKGFSIGNIKYYSENNLALAQLKKDFPHAKFDLINIHDDSPTDMFVLYENQEQALRHISYNLQGKYISYCKNHHNVYEWFKALQAIDPKNGKYAWATDPKYLNKLTSLVRKYKLYLIDI